MSETRENFSENRIEAAMSRQHNTTDNQSSAPDRGTEKLLGRREYDQALGRRLEQLNIAMGNEQAAPVTAATAQKIGHSTRQLLLVSGCAVLLGAGLTWFALSSTQNSEPLALNIKPPAASSRLAVSSSAGLPAPEKETPPAPQAKPGYEPEAHALLERWRQAWASRDIDAYLNFYSPDFVPEGQSHSKWMAARRAKLASQSGISLQIREIRIEQIDEQQMKVFFLQDYASGNYREIARAKTLHLQRSAGGWLIIGEAQVAKPAQP